MLRVDSKTIYLIGGYQDGKVSNKTWIFDPTKNLAIKEGPPMNHPGQGQGHASATMRLNNKVFIVVAGDTYGNPNSFGITTEILDTSLTSNIWRIGMHKRTFFLNQKLSILH